MWMNKTKLSIMLLFSLVCFSLSPAVCSCSPSQTYTISEQDLNALNEHLAALENNNEMLKSLLTEQDEISERALTALIESQNELARLKMKLSEAQSETKSAKESLQKANQELENASQYFKECEAAHEKTEKRLRTQRNVWEVLACIAVGFAVAQ